MTRHRKTGSMFGFLRELQREQSSLVQSQPVNFPEELEDKIAAEGGTGVGGSGAPPEPSSSMHDPAMIENEIHALKRQIRQASTVLTHVVQTMSVPTPAALINLMQQDTSLQDKPPQGSRPHPSGCSCAILHARDDGKFGTGREVAFLAACYCPDPWKFQERVLRQVESMQQELQIHRQEMLEVEKRTTMKLRQEILKWERTRDKECVELNELLRRSHLISDMDEKERQMDSIRGNNPPLDDRAEDHGMDKREGKSTCQSEAEHGGQGTDPTEKQLSDDGDAANHQSTER
ncbi:hypothetical protein BGZ65_006719 [Modicella reniformis]|uniref:Uncharacterized protein n=1 Tax=Modicella reniformis TaxID=1440133 RepID=A0A9P6JHN3_9FUNG|nr:hypothetical protein BGZ65_006719 [Modicella reniformis]